MKENIVKMMGFVALRDEDRQLSSSEWAFQNLWRRIVCGELVPGERVTEDQLADLLAVSRTPLREAIRRLEAIGFLLRRRNRTLLVAPLSTLEANELTLIRESLEVLVARLAARNHLSHPEKLEDARQLVERMKALHGLSTQPEVVLRLGDEFHAALLKISDSKRLEAMLAQLYLAIERYRFLLNMNHDRAGEIAQEHEAIINAVARGDEDGAGEAMKMHIEHSRHLYLVELQRVLGKPD